MQARKGTRLNPRKQTPAQPDYPDTISDEYLEFQRRKIEADYPGVKKLVPVGAPGW